LCQPVHDHGPGRFLVDLGHTGGECVFLGPSNGPEGLRIEPDDRLPAPRLAQYRHSRDGGMTAARIGTPYRLIQWAVCGPVEVEGFYRPLDISAFKTLDKYAQRDARAQVGHRV